MTRATKIYLIVITPERQVLQEVVSSVVFTAHDGEMGVLSGRAPLMCELGVGQIRYETGDQTRRIFIDGGFAQVYENRVTVLTQHATPEDDISAEMIAAAQQAVSELRGRDPATWAAREKAQHRLRVLRRLQPAQ